MRTSTARILATLLLLPTAAGWPSSADAGPNANVIFHANLDEHGTYNDVWGYTAPNGDEYALLGTTGGMAVINVTNPGAPYETGFFSGPTSTWRDIKTYGHYAYVVNETGGGMRIVDLADPENPSLVGTYTGGGLSTAHNLFIDESTARAYVLGYANTIGGFILLDLAKPESPAEITRWTATYLHDAMVQDGILYGSAINDPRLRVLDVSNPASITQIGTAEGYPSAFTHNAWVTEDNAYVMTTDEIGSGECRMWDLSTLPVLAQTDSYKPTPNTIPHNAHIEGDLAIISFYTLGLKIVDISDPYNLTEVASYDTWPAHDDGTFDGCWGAFPFFGTQTNLIVVSDVSTGLYVLEYRGELGAIAGTATRTGAPATPIADVHVEILQSNTVTTGDAAGQYLIEDVAGPVDVRFEAFGYEPKMLPATIATGDTTALDVTLDLLPSGSIGGVVTGGGAALAGVDVTLSPSPFAESTDGAGNYLHATVPVGAYVVRAMAFGYTPMEAHVNVTEGVALTVDFELNPALYATDFEAGTAGWTVVSTASRGRWELTDPQATSSGGTPIQPGDDHTPPPGTECWVTEGRSGTAPGQWDVDDGATVLTSPSFVLGSAIAPHVRYSRWYSTGVGDPDRDAFVVEVSTNGGGSWDVKLEDTEVSTNAWIDVDIALNDFFTPSNLTRFRFTAQDTAQGSLTEAALDDFMIYDGTDDVSGTHTPFVISIDGRLQMTPSRPNPFRAGEVSFLEFLLPHQARVRVDVFNVGGRRVTTLMDEELPPGLHPVVWDGRDPSGRTSQAGLYFLRLSSGDEVHSRKLLLLR